MRRCTSQIASRSLLMRWCMNPPPPPTANGNPVEPVKQALDADGAFTPNVTSLNLNEKYVAESFDRWARYHNHCSSMEFLDGAIQAYKSIGTVLVHACQFSHCDLPVDHAVNDIFQIKPTIKNITEGGGGGDEVPSPSSHLFPVTSTFRKALNDLGFSKEGCNPFEVSHPADVVLAAEISEYVALTRRGALTPPEGGEIDRSENEKNKGLTLAEAVDKSCNNVEVVSLHRIDATKGMLRRVPESSSAVVVVALLVAVPPARYFPYFPFFLNRVIGIDNQFTKMSMAALLAQSGVNGVLTGLDVVSRLLFGKPAELMAHPKLLNMLRIPNPDEFIHQAPQEIPRNGPNVEGKSFPPCMRKEMMFVLFHGSNSWFVNDITCKGLVVDFPLPDVLPQQ